MSLEQSVTDVPDRSPLRPRDQRPDPPLAEVQVAEEERLLKPWREVEEVGEPGSWYNLNRRDGSGGGASRRSAGFYRTHIVTRVCGKED